MRRLVGCRKGLMQDINSVEKRLGEKMGALRDRVSLIEGQLPPASIASFNAPKKGILI